MSNPSVHAGEPPANSADGLVIELGADDLPAHCPNPRMTAWSGHPRIFLDLAHTGSARCPYCSTVYRLKPGTVIKGH